MITRFAPSPTGLLHLGNARTAIIAYYVARSSGGKFILRIDDTDSSRVQQEYIEKIFEDLSWLGIEWDICVKQSERFELYEKAVMKLKAKDKIYPCYETPEELEAERALLLARGLPPVYRRKKRSEIPLGRLPYYRFELDPDQIVSWEDKLRGKIVIDLHSTSDPIVIRENGTYTYMLPSVVDDIECSVSSIIRGEDHISNTAVQLQMFKELGCDKLPEFAHMPLLKMESGKISKRTGGNAIEFFRKSSVKPEVICLYLLNLGSRFLNTFESIKCYENFNISHYSSSGSIIVVENEIYQLNTRFLRSLKYEDLAGCLDNCIPQSFWEVIKGNITFLPDAVKWWEICTSKDKSFSGARCDVELIKRAYSLLPEGEILPGTYKQWVDLIVDRHGYSKKDVYINLRLALTGEEHGPEMAAILPFIDRERILIRLSGLVDPCSK